MTNQTQDVIVWDDLPHPDPRSRRPRATVHAAAPFWSRLFHHLRDAANRDNDPERKDAGGVGALWARWLTSEAFEFAARLPTALTDLAMDRPAVDLAGRAGARLSYSLSRPIEPPAGVIPDEIMRPFREVLTASLQKPFAISFEPGPTSTSRPTHYCLILTNGASVMLATVGDSVDGDAPVLELQDCYFSWAVAEIADAMASPDEPACRRAAVTDLVKRYAIADESGNFMLPGPGRLRSTGAYGVSCDVTSSATTVVQFLRPALWGFADDEAGGRWTGYPPDHAPETSFGVARSSTASGRANAILSGEGPPGGSSPYRRYPLDAGTNGNSNGRLGDLSAGHQNSASGANGAGGLNGASSVNGTSGANRTDGANGTRGLNRTNGANGTYGLNGTNDRNGTHDPISNPQITAPATTAFNPTDRASLRSDVIDPLARPEFRFLLGAEVPSYQAAVKWGKCLAFGAARADGARAALPVSDAMAAGLELARRLVRWTIDAQQLRARLQSLVGLAAEDMRLGLFRARMEAWTAYIAIDETYAIALEAADGTADRLAPVVDLVLVRLEEFDAALERGHACLKVVMESQLLANWRTMLALPYRDTPPWWLDGSFLPHGRYVPAGAE